MPERLPFLSDEWVDGFAAAGAALPERPGASATMSIVVTGGPDGRRAERGWRFEFTDGRVTSAAVGALPEGEADLTILQPWDDAVAAFRGDDHLDEAFMRGTTKVVGPTGVLMRLLPVLRSEEWVSLCRSLADRTEVR